VLDLCSLVTRKEEFKCKFLSFQEKKRFPFAVFFSTSFVFDRHECYSKYKTLVKLVLVYSTGLQHWISALNCSTGLQHWIAALDYNTGLQHAALQICCKLTFF
jgi:hypothetical protein